MTGISQKQRAVGAVLLLALLNACSSVSVQDYANEQPALVMSEFFQGELVAHGVVKDWRGRVIRRFQAEISAQWQEGIGTLDEEFLFSDGETERRVWTLTPRSENRYDGTAGDVVGTGEIEIAGNTAFLDYVLRIPYGDGSIDVRVDDRMYLLTPSLLINESDLRKFGFKVGELLLVIAQPDAYSTDFSASGP